MLYAFFFPASLDFSAWSRFRFFMRPSSVQSILYEEFLQPDLKGHQITQTPGCLATVKFCIFLPKPVERLVEHRCVYITTVIYPGPISTEERSDFSVLALDHFVFQMRVVRFRASLSNLH